MALILASRSPRRQALLRQIGLEFTVRAADLDEALLPGLSPEEQVARLSAEKAAAVAAEAEKTDVILAADTIVVVGETILGKPGTPEQARQMLMRLSGRKHRVVTGFTVRQGDRQESCTEITELEFRTLSPAEIDAYVATGDPMDKAGAYGIQGLAAVFARSLSGDYYNVMGLPLCALTGVLRRFGIAVLGEKG